VCCRSRLFERKIFHEKGKLSEGFGRKNARMRRMTLRFFVVALMTGCLVSVGTLVSQTEPSPPGRLINVGGWRMHINCSGTARAGQPTVLLEAGSSDFSIDWAFVQPAVATSVRVCSYDRSGSGWSDLGPYPHTLKQIVFELHLLLEKAGESAPLVYVGHSYGGRIGRLYAATYPGDVRGMVFVDAGHEDSLVMLNGKLLREWETATGKPVPEPKATDPLRVDDLPANLRRQFEAAAAANANQPIGPPHNKLPSELQRARAWAMSQVKWFASNNSPFGGDEILALKNARAATAYPLDDMPVVVLTRGIPIDPAGERGAEREEERHRLAADLAALSRNGKRITASAATGHHIHIDEPQLVIGAIRDVVRASSR
jgi:pimeloyl-ACP methyl ester carboxylesterase